MAMSAVRSGELDPMIDMNTTPLIDVMMVLLILFIVTLPAMTNITKLDLPTAPGAVKREVIELTVDFDGVILWNGRQIQGLDELDRRFKTAASSEPELHVRPDKRAAYDTVAHVLASAQRNGVKRIAIAG